MNNTIPFFVFGSLLVLSAPAALTIVQSGGQLTSVNADGVVYNFTGPNRLVNGRLTAYSSVGPNSEALFAGTNPDPTSNSIINPPLPANRPGLLSDNRLDTGVINQSLLGTAEDTVFTFDTPIVNRPGPDIVFFEFASGGVPDAVIIRINGVDITNPGGYQNNLTGGTLESFTGNLTDSSGNTIAASSLAIFTDVANAGNQLRVATTTTLQNVSGILFDLSLFGVAEGASVPSITFGSSNATGVDPVFIAGLAPEPSRALFLTLALLLPVIRRRR